MGYYTDDGHFVDDRDMKKAAEQGYLVCPQCGKGHIKEFEFDDVGGPIYLAPCAVCGYQ